MWANSAAESLFGEPGGAPPGTAQAPAAARRPVHAIPTAASTAPPGSQERAAAAAAALAALGKPGLLRRVWARCLALFGRRASAARS